MDEPAYPLALADRAFAFEGAYRAPGALSAATRAAYGFRKPAAGSPRDSTPFDTAFRAALAPRKSRPPHFGGRAVMRPGPAPMCEGARAFQCAAAPKREIGTPRPSYRAPQRTCDRSPRTPRVYILTVASSGCAVRAVVWRGHVVVGGMRLCQNSMR